jgi:hypothetical protein
MVVRIHFDEAVVVLIGNQHVSGRVEVVPLGLGRERGNGNECGCAGPGFQVRQIHDNPPVGDDNLF